jgi:hypothetical protein
MKYIYTILMAMLITATLYAQAPEKMTYQAVVRNSNNELMSNSNIGMQISILQGSPTGTAMFVERQFPTTNANGLVSLEIGTGTLVSGDFSAIDWSAGPYFIKTEIDINGGSNYTITGTSELLSVPYALYAKDVLNDKVNDADHDIKNEIQTISVKNNILTLSKNGGSVQMPDESPWSKFEDVVYRTEGKIGIGTDNPHGKLTVRTDEETNNIAIENLSKADRGLVTGAYVNMSGSSKCNRIAVYNDIRATGTGNQTCTFNFMTADADAFKTGTSNYITGNSSKAFTGTENSISGDGDGGKYGSYNVIEKTAGGIHYAVYGEAEKAGSFAGYFKGDVYVSQKVKSAATGDGNLIPVAYGKFNANGTIDQTASTPNVTDVDHSTGRYVITITDIKLNKGHYVVVLSNAGLQPNIISYGYDASSKNLVVLVRNLDGDLIDGAFSIVIYKGS